MKIDPPSWRKRRLATKISKLQYKIRAFMPTHPRRMVRDLRLTSGDGNPKFPDIDLPDDQSGFTATT